VLHFMLDNQNHTMSFCYLKNAAGASQSFFVTNLLILQSKGPKTKNNMHH